MTQLPSPFPGTTITKTHYGSGGFEAVIEVRSTRCDDTAATDPADTSADHYVLAVHGAPLATMRVQQARRGVLECEEFYPQEFLRRFRSVTGSASRLVRRAGTKAEPALLRRFAAAVWRDQFEDGIRVDLINVHLPMQPYYRAMGYQGVPSSWFEHPRLGTASTVMFLIADRTAATSLAPCFDSAHDPAFLQILRQQLLTPEAQEMASA